MEATATGKDTENDNTEQKETIRHRKGQENREQGGVEREGDDDSTEVVVVPHNTEKSIENDDPKEVVEIEADNENKNKIPRGRTLTRSSRRSRQSPSTGRPQSSLRPP